MDIMKYRLNNGIFKAKKGSINLNDAILMLNELSNKEDNYFILIKQNKEFIQFYKNRDGSFFIDIPPLVQKEISINEAQDAIKDFFNDIDIINKYRKQAKETTFNSTKSNSIVKIFIFIFLIIISLMMFFSLFFITYIIFRIYSNISVFEFFIILFLICFLLLTMFTIFYFLSIYPDYVRPKKMRLLAEFFGLNYKKDEGSASNIIEGIYKGKQILVYDDFQKNLVEGGNIFSTCIKIGEKKFVRKGFFLFGLFTIKKIKDIINNN